MSSRRAVPRVDLAAPDVDARRQLVQGLGALGFVQLDNHGADTERAAALRAACDSFFALPDSVKAESVEPDPLANRGWRAPLSESLSYSLGRAAPPDLFESFNCGADDRVTGEGLFQATPWPASLPAFAPAAHGWLAEMAALSARLDRLIGDELGFDLAALSTCGPDTMACIDYRPGPADGATSVEGQQRMGAHSDYTSFTLLLADPVPGLQIVDETGTWVDVWPDPGSLLMNVGDLLAIWTNDAWPSTLHRVVPISAGAAPVRRSVAYFHYPDPGVVVSPLEGLRVPRYVPVSVEQHLRSKLASPKEQTASQGTMTSGDRLS